LFIYNKKLLLLLVVYLSFSV